MSTDVIAAPERALPVLMTILQTAEHLQVSTKTIRRWIDAGDLIAHRFGRQWRISNSDLRTFIRAHREV